MAADPTRAPRTTAHAFALAGGLLFVVSLGYGVAAYLGRFGRLAPAGASLSAAWGVNLLLFSAFVAHHSLFARALVKTRVDAWVGPALERSVYVWVASAAFIVVCALWRPVPGEAWQVTGPGAIAMTIVQMSGVVATYLGSRQLDVFRLAGIRQAFGASRAPGRIQDTGMFALVRHPIYFGWILMVWPTPHMTGTRLAFAAISTAYLVLAIPVEERSLRREFGAAYDDYARRVRWRMLPLVY